MKNYKKVQMVAKNAPTGSYAAGCSVYNRAHNSDVCRACERLI